MRILDRLQPIIIFVYFVLVIGISMFSTNIYLLISSLICSSLLLFLMQKKYIIKNIIFIICATILITVINMIINSNGDTVLFTILKRPFTFESFMFGLKLSLLFSSVINWFKCYNFIFTVDKFTYLFGNFIPSISLLLCMVIRLVPMYNIKTKQILLVSKCVNKGIEKHNSKKENMKKGVLILNTIMTYSLEKSIITADSMKSRGYGLANKTMYAIYKITVKDVVFLMMIVLLFILILILSTNVMLGVILSIVLFISPSLYIMIEVIKWNIIKLKM